MSCGLLWEQAIQAITGSATTPGFPWENLLKTPLQLQGQSNGLSSVTIELSTAEVVIGRLAQQNSMSAFDRFDIDPAESWIVETTGNDTFRVRSFNSATGAVGAATASQAIGGTVPLITQLCFSPAGDYIAVTYSNVQTSNDRNYGWRLYPFNKSSGTIGAAVNPPADTGVLADQSKHGIAWLKNGKGLLVVGTVDGTGGVVRLYAFGATTPGVIDAHVGGRTNGGLPATFGAAIAIHPSVATTTYCAVVQSASPYVKAHSITLNGSGYPTALGVAHSNPSTLPAGAGSTVAFSPSGDRLIVGCATSPYVICYPWTTSWGAAFAAPTSPPPGTITGIAWAANGLVVVLQSLSGAWYTRAYTISASAWGAQQSALESLSSGTQKRHLAIAPSQRWLVTASTSGSGLAVVSAFNPAADTTPGTVEALALVFTKLSRGATIEVWCDADRSYASPSYHAVHECFPNPEITADEFTSYRRDVVIKFPAPLTEQWIKLLIADPANTEGLIRAGYLIAGPLWVPSASFKLESATPLRDATAIDQPDGGIEVVKEGPRRRTIETEFGRLLVAEWRALAPLRARGKAGLAYWSPDWSDPQRTYVEGFWGRTDPPVDAREHDAGYRTVMMSLIEVYS